MAQNDKSDNKQAQKQQQHKFCVIGHGLIGTAACKYLAAKGEDVVLVGPSEGKAHGACYDEGRIYRILDPIESWSKLAQRSIDQYESIQNTSGVEGLFIESGLLVFGIDEKFMQRTRATAQKLGTPLEELSSEELAKKFAWLSVPASTKAGLWQQKQAGTISPRKLIEAQLRLAKHHGATYVDEVVSAVEKASDGDHFVVTLENSDTVLADNVLVATGVHSSVLPVLPEKIVVNLTGSQALFIELTAEEAKLMEGMPTIMYEGPSAEECFYMLPPIQYPDGSWLMKIGPSTKFSPNLKTLQDVNAWFERGHVDPEFRDVAVKTLKLLFPQLSLDNIRPLLCVTDNTPTLNCYIDMLAPGWGLASGGNGWAAKSSDEIGRLAADMMALPTKWTTDPDFPQKWFKAITESSLSVSESAAEVADLKTPLVKVESCAKLSNEQVAQAVTALSGIVGHTAKPIPPHEWCSKLSAELEKQWGATPSVLCLEEFDPKSTAWAATHPYVMLLTTARFCDDGPERLFLVLPR